MKTRLFDYNLPKELIAQYPAQPRDHSRLLVYSKKDDKISHDKFFNLEKYLQPGDVLVFNNTKVFPARLILEKSTGGKIEVFLLQDLGQGKWECLVGGRVGTSLDLSIGNKNICKIIKKNKNGNWIIDFSVTPAFRQDKIRPKGRSYKFSKEKFEKFLNQHGETPLPPYIKTKDSKLIRQEYQTVYADNKKKGSVAAPTAGLHFTKRLLKELNKFGVQQEFVTLHVGLGTFAPVKVQKIEDHKLHAEYAVLDKATCNRLNKAKREGCRIIAVGTTSVRVLEAATGKNRLKPLNDWINLFIYPGYRFKFINGMLTNFHLPQSSLLMLVSALVRRKKILEIYKKAIKKRYRFYSFGDGMLIL